MSRIIATALGITVLILAAPARADASSIVIGSTTYFETGTTEVVDASFLQPDGGISVNNYAGLVKVVVWGVGESRSTALNDAFYVYSDYAQSPMTPFNQGSYYQLGFGTSTLIGLNPGQNATGFIAYDLDAGTTVTPAYIPAYRSDHTYSFIIDTSLVSPSALHFGVTDGNYADNAGSYHIQLTQLQPAPVPVPEPGSLLLLGSGLALVVARRRRRA